MYPQKNPKTFAASCTNSFAVTRRIPNKCRYLRALRAQPLHCGLLLAIRLDSLAFSSLLSIALNAVSWSISLFLPVCPSRAQSSRVQAPSRAAFGRIPRWLLVSSIPTHQQTERMSTALSACLLCGARFVLLPASANLLLRVWGFLFPPRLWCCLHALLELGRARKEQGNEYPSTSGVIKNIRSFSNRKILVWKCYYCSS